MPARPQVFLEYHGRGQPRFTAQVAGPTSSLRRLYVAAHAGAGARRAPRLAPAADDATLVSPALLPNPRFSDRDARPQVDGPSDALRVQSRLLYRHHGPGFADRGILRRQGGGRKLAAVRLAGQAAALGLRRAARAQGGGAPGRDERPSRTGRRLDPVSRGHQQRRQPGAAVQERPVLGGGAAAAGRGAPGPARLHRLHQIGRHADGKIFEAALRLVRRHGNGQPPVVRGRTRPGDRDGRVSSAGHRR